MNPSSMISDTLQRSGAGPNLTSLPAKLLNLFVSPAMVFDEVIAAPHKLLNWLVPTVLVCLSGLAFFDSTTNFEATEAAIRQQLDAETITQDQAAALKVQWNSVSRASLCCGAFLGTFWSAFVLWFMGRVFLRSRFGFMKALEVAGLAATVLVLGTVVTGLLALAVGDASARPSLALLCSKVATGDPIYATFGIINCFQLWTTGVLAIGLSRLAGSSIGEAAFWVFGYWTVVRIALTALA